MDQFAPSTSRVLRREQEMKFGTQLLADGVRFRLWAPQSQTVSLLLEKDPPRPMQSLPRGWFELDVTGAGPGSRYGFLMENGLAVPDPASRYQPDDVHGMSEVIDPQAFAWTDIGWRGRPWEEAVFYQLHVGTFTPEGTFAAAMARLDYLAGLGITAIQLLPLADFPGRWNWGYDGALLFAPDSTYGRPEDLKAFINEAHNRGLMVFLDVVYNHFGPEGNYLTVYAPALTDKHRTPWGPAVNYDDEGSLLIRDFVIANARYWLNEFRCDGLRFDAVHAIEDSGPKHLLQDLAEQVRAATDGRHIHLVVENSRNEANWMVRRGDGTPGLYTAQWNDDIHHLLHATTTGESFGYYANFAGRIDLLGRALAEGFAWQGEYSEHDGAHRGEPSAYLPPSAFVSYIQNHDQAGNRPHGDRIGHLIPPEASRMLAALYLLSPQVPLVFMGEEWLAAQPFPYFSDLGGDLGDQVRAGRAAELAAIPGGDDPDNPPADPMAEQTFLSAKLDWSDLASPQSEAHLDLYRRLIALRRAEIVPRLTGIGGHCGNYEVIGPTAVRITWTLVDDTKLSLLANLSPEPLEGVDVGSEAPLWLEGTVTPEGLGPWSVLFRLS